MRQNKEIFEKYADKLLSAMKREGLMNKDVAEIFAVPASYMSNLIKRPEKTPMPFMEKVRTWDLSGKLLRGYKPPESTEPEPVTKTQEQKVAELYTAIRKKRSKLAVKQLVKEHDAAEAAEIKEEIAAAIAESVSTEEPTREEIAADIRQQYENVQPQEVTVSVICKNDKVDVSRLDSRTGVIASAELFFDENGAFHLTYKYKS
jgi:hypothetical protein